MCKGRWGRTFCSKSAMWAPRARSYRVSSKAIDDVSSFNISGSGSVQVAGENDLAQNPFDLGAERGPSLFDARHRLVFSYQWTLPFWQHGHEMYKRVLGGWQLNGIATMMSGT